MFQNILKILSLYLFIISIGANTDCYDKFSYEMEKNLNDKNLTLNQLKQHILIANYYLDTTFYNKNNNHNELKILKNICDIDYNKLDYPQIKRKIKISNESKDKLIRLINTRHYIYKLYYYVVYYTIYFISLYLFIKYKFLIFPLIVYIIFNNL